MTKACKFILSAILILSSALSFAAQSDAPRGRAAMVPEAWTDEKQNLQEALEAKIEALKATDESERSKARGRLAHVPEAKIINQSDDAHEEHKADIRAALLEVDNDKVDDNFIAAVLEIVGDYDDRAFAVAIQKLGELDAGKVNVDLSSRIVDISREDGNSLLLNADDIIEQAQGRVEQEVRVVSGPRSAAAM